MTVQGSFLPDSSRADAPDGFNWVALPPLAGSVDAAQAANPQTLSVSATPSTSRRPRLHQLLHEAENLAAIAEAER